MISIKRVWKEVGMSGWCHRRPVALGATWVALEW